MKTIELGGGENPQFRPNVDVRAGKNVDIVADFNKPLDMLKSDSYDMVFSRYNIEHINWRNIKQFVSEMYRICGEGGMVFVTTANLLEQCKQAIAWGNDWERISQMIFGDLTYDENSHKVGWSPESFKKLFEDAGFVTVVVTPLNECITDMILEAQKPYTIYVPVSRYIEENKNESI
jgi:ubiquinone/menaquinone biosynthesis C-methylase UbiE